MNIERRKGLLASQHR